MPKPGMGWEHQKRRADLPPPQGEQCPCTGCAKHPGMACRIALWPHNSEADHVQARALGGINSPLRWMCRGCNRSRGATLGNRLRGARRAASAPLPRAPRTWHTLDGGPASELTW
jgi:hypothetical protein